MNDKQALEYKLNPVDNLAPLAKAKIPILAVIGDTHDWVVPIEENALVVEKRYKELEGDIQIIKKPKAGHRPHSLIDPAPIVEFVLKHTGGGNGDVPRTASADPPPTTPAPTLANPPAAVATVRLGGGVPQTVSRWKPR